jgi:hypothetical protein
MGSPIRPWWRLAPVPVPAWPTHLWCGHLRSHAPRARIGADVNKKALRSSCIRGKMITLDGDARRALAGSRNIFLKIVIKLILEFSRIQGENLDSFFKNP